MLKLDDERWSDLTGGYKVAYDPRPALRALTQSYDDRNAWDELWNELHHQGDVGDASYAAIPALVRISVEHHPAQWALYGLAATIEEARLLIDRNPPIPDWLDQDYAFAWRTLFELALRDLRTETEANMVNSALAVIALHRGQLTLGRIAMCPDDERKEMLDQYFGKVRSEQ